MALFDHAGLARDIAARATSIAQDHSAAALATAALRSGAVELTAHGAISAQTGVHTGRSPKDKFVVRDSLTQNHVWWDNCGAMSLEHFDLLLADALAHLAGQDVHCQNLLAGADRGQQYGVAVYTPSAWHALFIRNLLIRPSDEGQAPRDTDVTIVHVPGFKADPARHGTRTETVIALDMSRNVVVIGGTFYAGEIKKSVFSLFNFHAPLAGVLPMHCSANIGAEGDTALFFGLSGTGKTTLSTDPERVLIGDDEHGWGEAGVFNLEGGCYAKTIKLSAKAEPEIFAATQMFGTVLENVVLDTVSKQPDFDDGSRTENTRAAYPLSAMPHVSATGTGPTPKTVVFLTADAFGVLPPIAKLSTAQAVYHFLSGYTAKVAGTERGVTEPQATFSACFGAPFMSHHPLVYGRMLADKLEASGATTWLVNTGWMGGAYGTGQRISIAATRRLLKAALSGELDAAEMRVDPVFGFAVPKVVAGVDDSLLDPRESWADKQAYDAQAEKLVGLFIANFARFSEASEMVGAGPRLAQAAE